MSMRVERSTLDQVKKRFEVNKKKMEEKQKDYDFEERMKELREEVRLLTLLPTFGILPCELGVALFLGLLSDLQFCSWISVY